MIDVFVARVIGAVVATLKHPALKHAKLLIVQPCDPAGHATGAPLTALDRADAGVGDRVLVVDEGSSASQILGTPRGPVRTVVVGVVDAVETTTQEP